jgi:hypothetical protein
MLEWAGIGFGEDINFMIQKSLKRGKGVNSTVFWVTHDIKGDWIQLPDS